jgi:hypothetical protein
MGETISPLFSASIPTEKTAFLGRKTSCAQKVVDTADIVKDAIFHQLSEVQLPGVKSRSPEEGYFRFTDNPGDFQANFRVDRPSAQSPESEDRWPVEPWRKGFSKVRHPSATAAQPTDCGTRMASRLSRAEPSIVIVQCDVSCSCTRPGL